MRSERWSLDARGDWGMLGRVRDLARMGLCNFLSSDLVGNRANAIAVAMANNDPDGGGKK